MHTVALRALTLSVLAAILVGYASADSVSTPSFLFIGTVTRVGTVSEPQWRIVNFGALAGFAPVNLSNVTLTFDYIGGSQTYFWSSIPTSTIVETNPFNPSLVLTSLSIQFTLGQKTIVLGPRSVFIADSLVNTASENALPPPLDFGAKGTTITTVPEPSSLFLLGTGLVGVLRARGRKRIAKV